MTLFGALALLSGTAMAQDAGVSLITSGRKSEDETKAEILS